VGYLIRVQLLTGPQADHTQRKTERSGGMGSRRQDKTAVDACRHSRRLPDLSGRQTSFADPPRADRNTAWPGRPAVPLHWAACYQCQPG